MKKSIAPLLLFSVFNFGRSTESPFNYDLNLTSLPGKNARVMICFHGYGDNYKIALFLKNLKCIGSTLISFNFPEYDIKQGRNYDFRQASFGTIDELLPALYVMNQTVLDQDLDSMDLYGFSAGGGAVINVIRILNTSTYDESLKKIGIGTEEKKRLLCAIQKGVVILDTPLKSIEEIIDYRGSTEELKTLAKNYKNNGLRPIDSLEFLKGLSLDIILHFQEKDEILSNRDDSIFIERLKASQTKVRVVFGEDGGHEMPHMSLWRYYSEKYSEMNSHFKIMETSAGKVAYVDSDGSGFPVVFIHGNSVSSAVFKKQFAHLGRQYRIIAIDLPGHGKSDDAKHPDSTYTIPGYAKILDEVVTELQLNPFAVVGFSLGGNIALQWTQISEHIKGIMMISSAPMKYSEEALIAYLPYEGSCAANPDPLTETQAIQYMKAGGFDTQDPSVYFMIQDAMRTDGAARAKMVASVLAGKGFDETKIVSQLEIPLAVIIGKEDRVVNIEYINHLSYRNLWRNKVELLEDAQHSIVLHQADQLQPLLEDFLLEIAD